MRNNKIIIICLSLAGILTAGVLFSRAAGFVTYENNNTMILWDSARVIGQGLNFGTTGAENGDINLGPGKDIYVKKYVGFDCPNYPDPSCGVSLGDLGGFTFLKINEVAGNDLLISSEESNIAFLNPVQMNGKLFIENESYLLVSKSDLSKSPSYSVYANNLRVNEIADTPTTSAVDAGLTFTWLKMDQGAVFKTKRIIDYTVPCCASVPTLCPPRDPYVGDNCP